MSFLEISAERWRKKFTAKASPRAEIEMPDGARARLHQDGEWECAEAHWRSLLRELSAGAPLAQYLPDPAGERLRAVVAATGACIVQEQLPASEGGAEIH